MKVNAVRCRECGDTIYSRARHDFRECSCGSSFVDGGSFYLRYGGCASAPFEIDIKVTDERELYKDWNNSKDKFGLIKGIKSLEE